jgi:hypothetical protein
MINDIKWASKDDDDRGRRVRGGKMMDEGALISRVS